MELALGHSDIMRATILVQGCNHRWRDLSSLDTNLFENPREVCDLPDDEYLIRLAMHGTVQIGFVIGEIVRAELIVGTHKLHLLGQRVGGLSIDGDGSIRQSRSIEHETDRSTAGPACRKHARRYTGCQFLQLRDEMGHTWRDRVCTQVGECGFL